MSDLGALSPVNVREVWAGESRNFTPWLAENADQLGEALGMDLIHEQTEAPVGRYSADLVFRESSTDKLIVVENMFDATDHDHLSKLITYAAGLGASYAVLLSPEFREEHRSALDWLNTVSVDDFGFFGVVLEAWRIGDSLPAPRLRVDVKPDSWSRSVRAVRVNSELNERKRTYQRFWGEFLTTFRSEYPDWTRAAAPSKLSWMGFPSPRSNLLKYNAAFCRSGGNYRLRAEVYIDTRDKGTTKAAFDDLHRRKEQIEEAVGEVLEWSRLDNRRASRVSIYFPHEIRISDEERWPEALPWLVEAMGRMRDAFNPALQELQA